MAATYIPITSITLSASAASVTFSGIPQTYTDLVLRMTVRRAEAGRQDLQLAINAVTDAGANIWLQGNGASATSGTSGGQYIRINNIVPSTNETANTFGAAEFYISNYAANAQKPVQCDGAGENNSTTAYLSPVASLYTQTTAVSSLVLSLAGGTFVTGSTFYLYGIKNT